MVKSLRLMTWTSMTWASSSTSSSLFMLASPAALVRVVFFGVYLGYRTRLLRRRSFGRSLGLIRRRGLSRGLTRGISTGILLLMDFIQCVKHPQKHRCLQSIVATRTWGGVTGILPCLRQFVDQVAFVMPFLHCAPIR